jgi:hypothetical protein
MKKPRNKKRNFKFLSTFF